jgi:hypothetical protein
VYATCIVTVFGGFKYDQELDNGWRIECTIESPDTKPRQLCGNISIPSSIVLYRVGIYKSIESFGTVAFVINAPLLSAIIAVTSV